MSQVQTSRRRRILNRGVSICAMCKKSCDGRLCGWANTLKTENLPEGAEFVLSRVERDKSNKEKSYYKITSCPVFECGHSRTTPEDAAALRLAERLLWELSEGFEQALINGDRAAEREYEYDIRSCWIWHIFAQSGLNDKTADSCIAAIRQRVEDARQYDFIADQMKQKLKRMTLERQALYKEALRRYRETGAIDVVGTRRVINNLHSLITAKPVRDINRLRISVCDNILSDLANVSDKPTTEIKKTEKKAPTKRKRKFIAHEAKTTTPEPKADKADKTEAWLADWVMYLNLMC